MSDTSFLKGGGQFPETQWSMVLAAGDPALRAERLDALIRQYWRPVYMFIRQAWRKPNADAKDLTQAFFAQLLERDLLERSDPARGQFRAYLKTCLRNFLANEHAHQRAQRRGGGRVHVPIDELGVPAVVEHDDPEQLFDREWAHAVLGAAVERMDEVMTARGRALGMAMFRALYVDAVPGEAPSYEDLSRTHDVPLQTVKLQIDYARQLYRKVLAGVAREYCADEAEAGVELERLFPL